MLSPNPVTVGTVTGVDASERFSRQKTADTEPELALRSMLHARGLRYRLHLNVIPGTRRTHDLVFVAARVAVDVHGCFWHGCLDHYVPPKTNRAFWAEKIATNRKRDRDTDEKLRALGWEHIVVWEHEDPERAADRIERTVRGRFPGTN